VRAGEPQEGPLAGLKVLDIGHQIAGPYCARLLADQGAEVTKIERPGKGGVARSLGSFVGDDPHPEKGLTFLYLNYNKRSLTLDLKTAEGREVFFDLVRTDRQIKCDTKSLVKVVPTIKERREPPVIASAHFC